MEKFIAFSNFPFFLYFVFFIILLTPSVVHCNKRVELELDDVDAVFFQLFPCVFVNVGINIGMGCA